MLPFLLAILGCQSAPPVLTCPEGTEVVQVEPVQGLAGAWCERRNGSRHGPWRQWRLDGTPYAEGAYHNNRKSGTFTWWHANGIKREEATYEQGKRQGLRTEWDEAGAVVRVERYEKGERVEAE